MHRHKVCLCAKYRIITFSLLIRPLFPCFEIQYTINFLVEFFFSYLFNFLRQRVFQWRIQRQFHPLPADQK